MRAPRTTAIVLAFAVLTVAMTWPLLSIGANVVPDIDDAYFSVWRLAWVAHQLPRGPAHLFDANIFHPTPGTLAFSDAMLLVSVLGAPAIWLGVNAPLVHNLLTGAAFVSSMWLTFLLVRGLTRSAGAGWIAALIFGFAPYRMAHLGHLELQWVMFMPLGLWLLHRYVATPTARRALAVGGAVAGQTLCSIYYGVFLSLYLFAALIILLAMRAHVRRRAAALTPLMLIPLLAVAAIYGPPYANSRAQHGARNVTEITEYSAAPEDFLRVPPGNRLRGRNDSRPAPEERSLYPGTATVILAAAAFVPPVAPSAWMYLALTAISVDAALGMNGVLFPVLQRMVPTLTSLRAPARCGVLVLLSLTVLAGYGAAKIVAARPGAAAAFVVIATVLSLAEFWSAPIMVRPNQEPPTEAHRWLSHQPEGTVVVEMPLPTNDSLWRWETTYLIRSTHHWQPLVNGYSGFVPEQYRQTLVYLQGFPDERSIERLRELNVRFIVLNRRYYGAEEYTDLIARVTRTAGLRPAQRFATGQDEIVIVEMDDGPAAVPSLAERLDVLRQRRK
jgi:hypothetical protein